MIYSLQYVLNTNILAIRLSKSTILLQFYFKKTVMGLKTL